jgi:hypothetical protein
MVNELLTNPTTVSNCLCVLQGAVSEREVGVWSRAQLSGFCSTTGNILSRSTDVFIGQAGTGTSREYFTGLIDEVKIYSR